MVKSLLHHSDGAKILEYILKTNNYILIESSQKILGKYLTNNNFSIVIDDNNNNTQTLSESKFTELGIVISQLQIVYFSEFLQSKIIV